MKKHRNNFNTILSSLLFSTTVFAGGNGVGNGGIAYVCRDEEKKITQAELLDLWEPETYKIIRSSEPIDTQITRAAERITIRFPEVAEKFHAAIFDMKKMVLMTDRKLAPTQDALPNFEPEKGCNYEQVARYSWVNDIGEMKLLINREIFESPQFSNTDRAALYIHETLYATYTTAIEWLRMRPTESLSGNYSRIAKLPFTSQISRQIVQAAFKDYYAVAHRHDLNRELAWILRYTVKETKELSPIPFEANASPTLEFNILPILDSVCDFSVSQNNVKSQKFSLRIGLNDELLKSIKSAVKIGTARRINKASEEIKKANYKTSFDLIGFKPGSPLSISWKCTNKSSDIAFAFDAGTGTYLGGSNVKNISPEWILRFLNNPQPESRGSAYIYIK